MATATAGSTASMMINLVDGTRNDIKAGTEVLVTVVDGWQTVHVRKDTTAAHVSVPGLPIFNNSGDNYTVLASSKGYSDTGFFPVKVLPGVNLPVDLMLLPRDNALNFSKATWKPLGQSQPDWQKLIAKGAASAAAAQKRYGDLEDQSDGAILACTLNLLSAMSEISLPQGTPLDYIKMLDWNRLAQDRFFAFCDPALLDQVKLAKQHGTFASAPFGLHPGATDSYKQIQFGEANVQLTFHENDRQMINGVNCIVVEPDIDYFRDPGAHLLFEVLVNAFGSLSDPRQVYVLRWIAGQHAGVPEFDPLYTIEQA
jgi:hypothetical protein